MSGESSLLQHSRIPSGRIERFAKIGWLAGRMALGAAAEGARRVGSSRENNGHVLLTEANARRLVNSLSNMRGAAMKLGQLLSLEAEDLLPPEASAALATLRDAGDAMPPDQLHGVLNEQWGADWPLRFRSFDCEPIAAASIGQVHTGVTTDGRELALKIQYPGVARSIDSDVDNLATALRMSRILPGDVDFDPLIEEAKRQLRQESNYESEASHLRRYASLLSDEPDFVVPGVHSDLSTGSILAMDRLRGVPLEDLCSPEYSDEQRDRAGTALFRLLLRELFEFRFSQSDPNFANYLRMPDGRIGLIDLGAGYDVAPKLSRDYARLFRAAIDSDPDRLHTIASQIGFLQSSDDSTTSDAIVDLISMAIEPFRHDGAYDFGRSDLPARARESSMALVVKHGFWRPPPPETLLLQRKLGGTFLLCTRLRARVNARALLEEALASN
jgi:predicted unusual protein kinase regulating ubiquinone biosynthesis (AarF/ABC1/UbiB family)